MARIFTDGAETGDVTFWDTDGAGNCVVDTTARNGTYSYRSTAGDPNFYPQKNIANLSEFYFRSGFRYTGVPATGYNMVVFRNGSNTIATVRRNQFSGFFEIYRGDGSTLLGTGSIVRLVNTWFLMEIYFKLDDTVGRFQLKIDGVSDINFTGDTNPGAYTYIDGIRCGGSATTTYFDDLALNDTSGGADNSWCGDGKVLAFVPNAAGDSTQWTPSTGSNYQCVDEIPPNNTDYVEATTTGFIDNYNMSTYAMTAGESVLRVWSTALARDTLSAGTLKLGLKTASTNYTSTVNVGTGFVRVNGTVHTVNPNTSAAWTQAQLDALQATLEMP